MNEKDRRLSLWCAERKLDGVFLRRRCNIAWITDGADVHCDAASSLGIASVVWTPRSKIVLTDDIEAARLRAEELSSEWEIRGGRWWEPPQVPPIPGGRFATDWPDDAIAELRFSLTPLEIERAKDLGAESAHVVQRVLPGVRRGTTERDVAADLAGALRRRGIFLHVTLVAADERIGLYRHPIPTAKRVERCVMAAVCAQRRGLIVCLTRLVHFGALPGDLRRRHDAVCRVDAVLHAATRTGARWCDVLGKAIAAYAEEGFPEEWRKHHQGGPMGYEPRDFKATPAETRTVVEGQLVGWNPTITGTKSEDTILSDGSVITAMSDWPMNGARPDILLRT